MTRDGRADGPRLTVVVAGSRPDGPAPALLDALRAPIAAGAVELIVVTARAVPGAGLPADAAGIEVVVAPPGTPVPRLLGLGLAAARAPRVALTEDFCVPGPRWVERLLAAHDRLDSEPDVVAIGGSMARLGGLPSHWALSFVEYGRYFGPAPAGPVDDLPAPNVSYRVDRLVEVLGERPAEIETTWLHARLRERGAVLWREPEVRVYDADDRPLGAAALALFHHGRHYGGTRVQGAGPVTRVARALASPLVPALQLTRLARSARAAHLTATLVAAAPRVLVLLVAWAVGEGLGSLLGPGRSAERWA